MNVNREQYILNLRLFIFMAVLRIYLIQLGPIFESTPELLDANDPYKIRIQIIIEKLNYQCMI